MRILDRSPQARRSTPDRDDSHGDCESPSATTGCERTRSPGPSAFSGTRSGTRSGARSACGSVFGAGFLLMLGAGVAAADPQREPATPPPVSLGAPTSTGRTTAPGATTAGTPTGAAPGA